tara:strand:+ start:272 stop:562 length:291 start_codon:yes stop_codon:yes gene_type:complete
MLQGVCICKDDNDKIILLMYKELYNSPGQILLLIYYENYLFKMYITTRKITEIIPREAVHILYNLPYDVDENIMIEKWRTKIIHYFKKFDKFFTNN